MDARNVDQQTWTLHSGVVCQTLKKCSKESFFKETSEEKKIQNKHKFYNQNKVAIQVAD